MRMWMLPPKGLCRKHLLGEHVELHMLLGSMRRGKNIDGFLLSKKQRFFHKFQLLTTYLVSLTTLISRLRSQGSF